MVKNSIFSLRDEARLAAWHRQTQARKDQGRREGPCITISREFGCQAYPLAAELAKRLGDPWVVIDKEVLEEVAKITGFTIEQIERSRDTPPVLKAIFAMFLDASRADETQIYGHLHQAIHKFAVVGHCIIVGSGGVFAAREVKNVLNLRLVAPMSFRVTKIQHCHDMDQTQAVEYVERHQKQREEFIGRLAGGRVDEPLLYHLVLNNGLFNPEQMAALAVMALEQLGISD